MFSEVCLLLLFHLLSPFRSVLLVELVLFRVRRKLLIFSVLGQLWESHDSPRLSYLETLVNIVWRCFEGCCAPNRANRNVGGAGFTWTSPLCSIRILMYKWLKTDISKSLDCELKISKLFYLTISGTLMVTSASHFFLPFRSFIQRGVNGPNMDSLLRFRVKTLLFVLFPFTFNAGASMRGIVMTSHKEEGVSVFCCCYSGFVCCRIF